MKDELRKLIKKKRNNLSKNYVFKKSLQIKKLLFNLDEFKQANTILFYISYDNEVFTHDMIKEALKNEKHVIVPISNKESRTLILSKLESWDDLKLGAYNILEPIKEKIKEISYDQLDLIITPGVAFDIKGRRLGHGKGYYDSLLKQTIKTVSIGLAFEFQIIDHIPVEKHDISVDKIITEKRIINCSK